MPEAAAVDVPGRDLGHFDLRLADRLCGPVVAQASNPGEGTGARPRARDHLAASLAVHADVTARFLDKAVRFAGNDESVLSQADIEALTAATKRKVQLVGEARRIGGDADGTIETAHGLAERLPGANPAAIERATRVGTSLASVVTSAGTATSSETTSSA